MCQPYVENKAISENSTDARGGRREMALLMLEKECVDVMLLVLTVYLQRP